MKRLSMLLFFGAGMGMALLTFYLPTRDPVSAGMEELGLLIFGMLFVLALVAVIALWRRPQLVYGQRWDAVVMLLLNLCVLLAVMGETMLFRSQFSTMVILWPMVLVAGFMRRTLLWPQVVLGAACLFIFSWLKMEFIRQHNSVVWLVEFMVSTVPLIVTSLSVSYFRRAAIREAQQLKQSMNTDFLTGLANRRALFEQFPGLLRAIPTGRQFTVVLLDLDHFKTINDRFGHQVGDEVLQLFAAALAAHTQPSELAVRLGGEEFVWIISETSQERLLARIEDLRANFAGRSEARGVTVSAGVVPAPTTAQPNLTELLNAADKLLYQAKAAGRNQVVLASTPAFGLAPDYMAAHDEPPMIN